MRRERAGRAGGRRVTTTGRVYRDLNNVLAIEELFEHFQMTHTVI
jgi:hypothetical protein